MFAIGVCRIVECSYHGVAVVAAACCSVCLLIMPLRWFSFSLSVVSGFPFAVAATRLPLITTCMVLGVGYCYTPHYAACPIYGTHSRYLPPVLCQSGYSACTPLNPSSSLALYDGVCAGAMLVSVYRLYAASASVDRFRCMFLMCILLRLRLWRLSLLHMHRHITML